MSHDNQPKKLAAAIAQVKAIFETSAELYVWILNYSITHSVLTFVVHDGNYLKGQKVICGGCDYLSGPLQGGPYNLTINYESQKGLPAITIQGNDHELVIKCSRISAPIAQDADVMGKNGGISAEVAARLAHLNQQMTQSIVQDYTQL